MRQPNASTTMPAVRPRDGRAGLFRGLAGACALLLLVSGGITSILAPWGSPGGAFPGFTPEIHRWHSALLGVFEAILLPGLLLALWRRPREHPLLMQFFLLVGIALVVPHLLVRGSTPVSSVFLLFPVLSYPAPRELLRIPRGGRTSTLLLVLGLLAFALLAFDMWSQLLAQITSAGGEHARHGHWATAFSLDVVLILAILIAASGKPGWQALSLVAGTALIYLGAAALALPNHAGSWGALGGGLALAGGAGLLAATWREGSVD